jgi:RNA polymerase sigma factor (sigma-70 family)
VQGWDDAGHDGYGPCATAGRGTPALPSYCLLTNVLTPFPFQGAETYIDIVEHESKLNEQPEDSVDSPVDSSRADLVARLFREHNDALVSLLVLRLRSQQDAKEVAQEAYVRLLQLDRSDGAISLMRSYLFRIASNLAIDRLRHRNVRWHAADAVKAELFESFSPQNSMEQGLAASEELDLVQKALAELPASCQRAFWMHRAQGATVAQIAGVLKVTERMVRHHLSRALIYCQLRLGGASETQAKERLKR